MRRGVVGLAVALLLSACSPAPPPLADAALSSGGADDDARAVYVAPVAADGDRHAGDGGPASEAVVSDPQAIAVGADGSLYVLEPNAVRRITPDGIIATVAGSDRSDPPDLPPSLGWGSAGVGFQRPDPRPLPAGPVVAADFPLPRLTALDVAEDGTIWLASHDAVLRLGTDGLLAVHADATTVVPDDPSATLVGPRGLSSSITSLHVHGDALVLVDEWSATLLRLDGQRLSLVLGRSQAEPDPCPSPVLGSSVPADRVCAARYVQTRDGDRFVVHFGGVLAVPGGLLG